MRTLFDLRDSSLVLTEPCGYVMTFITARHHAEHYCCVSIGKCHAHLNKLHTQKLLANSQHFKCFVLFSWFECVFWLISPSLPRQKTQVIQANRRRLAPAGQPLQHFGRKIGQPQLAADMAFRQPNSLG